MEQNRDTCRVMQTFKVGDKAVYPGQGVGEVMGIEHKDIAGQRQSFYVLKIMENGMKILIPINKVGSVGLRSLIDEKAVNKVYGILKQKDISVDSATWNRRYREYMEKIKTGSVFEIAEVLRDLYLLKFDKDLSFGERKMLDTARNLLIKELSLAKGVNEDDIEGDLKTIFNCCSVLRRSPSPDRPRPRPFHVPRPCSASAAPALVEQIHAVARLQHARQREAGLLSRPPGAHRYLRVRHHRLRPPAHRPCADADRLRRRGAVPALGGLGSGVRPQLDRRGRQDHPPCARARAGPQAALRPLHRGMSPRHAVPGGHGGGCRAEGDRPHSRDAGAHRAPDRAR